MRAGWIGQGLKIVAGAVIVLSVVESSAEAARHKSSAVATRHAVSYSSNSSRVADRSRSGRRHSWRQGGLQCVPFARENSGIELSGNAGTWWNNASGLYERGARPEVGSILNFRATGHMRMGHVAVVTNVLSPRHIEIDHANWGAPGRVSRNIDVVDVSSENDWTAVRVALSQAEDYGSTYPTYGFIYDRPDHGVMVANSGVPTSGPASADQKVASARMNGPAIVTLPEEVAEAASDDDDAAPRYSSRHRSTHSGHMGGHTGGRSLLSSRSRSYSPFPTASTFRVSTHPTPSSKSGTHKTGKHRL